MSNKTRTETAGGTITTGDPKPSVAAHTPTPWRIFKTPDGRKLVGIGDQNSTGILDAGFGVWRWNDREGIANAELVVRAVNSHADMLAALRSAVEWLSSASDSKRDGTPFQRDVTAMCAAIAKATGATITSGEPQSNAEGLVP